MRPLARPDRASDRFSEDIDVTYDIRQVIPDLVKRHARGAAVARSGLLTVGDGLQACAATSLDDPGGFPFTQNTADRMDNRTYCRVSCGAGRQRIKPSTKTIRRL